MKSMTAYGYAEFSNDMYLMTMELKSYNNRYLEVSYNAPQVLSPYEAVITDLIKQYAQRGHIDFSIKIKNLRGNALVNIDESSVDAYLDAMIRIRDMAAAKGISINPTMTDIISRDGILTNVNTEGLEAYREGLDYCSAQVMKQFSDAKNREGEVTRKDLSSMIDSIDGSLDVVKQNVDGLENMIKENLTSRLNEMLSDKNYDENRILTEVAVMLNRYTINEETVRLSAHIAEFRKLLDSREAVGKRIDFLCQEMNREINTIGSKSQMVNVNFEVVNMKDCLENIREQIRNIE